MMVSLRHGNQGKQTNTELLHDIIIIIIIHLCTVTTRTGALGPQNLATRRDVHDLVCQEI